MQRRSFIGHALIGACFVLPALAVAQPVTLKFSHEAPETAIKGRTAKLMAEPVRSHEDLASSRLSAADLLIVLLLAR